MRMVSGLADVDVVDEEELLRRGRSPSGRSSREV